MGKSKKRADKERDAVLKRMLKTAPRRHKDEPTRAVVKRKTKPKG